MNNDHLLMVEDKEELAKSNKNIEKVFALSFIFLMLFSAFNSASNVCTQIYRNLNYGSFGKVTALILYISFAVSDFLAPFILTKLSRKHSMFTGALGYTLYVVGGLWLTSCDHYNKNDGICVGWLIIFVNIIGAMTCGSGAALLWIAQASYVDCCANEFNKGKFFGIFWSITQASFILGNVCGAILLKSWNPFVYYIFMFILILVSNTIMLFIPDVESLVLKDKKKQLSIQEDIKSRIRGIVRISSLDSFRPLIYYFLFSGFSVAVYSTFESLIVESAVTINNPDAGSELNNLIWEKTEYLFIGQGLVSVINSFVVGKLFDSISTTKSINGTNFGFIFGMVSALIAYTYSTYGFALAMGMLWAFGDSSVRILNSAIIAKDFKGRIEAFAASRIFNELGVISGLLLSITLGDFTYYIFIFVIIIITVMMQIKVSHYDSNKVDIAALKAAEDKDESNYHELNVYSST